MQKTADTGARNRLEREIERERDQRCRNDNAKSDLGHTDDFRNKDARDNDSATHLQRR